MWNSRLFRAGIGILLLFLIILVGTQISFLFRPLIIIINTLFFPILIAGVFYFVTFPLVDWLQKRKIPRTLAILLLYLFIVGLLVILFFLIGPILHREAEKLLEEAPGLIEDLQGLLLALERTEFLARVWEQESFSLDNLAARFSDLIQYSFSLVVDNISSFLEGVANFLIILILVPFILFYMLRDGHQLPDILMEYVPEKHATRVRKTLADMYEATSSYIQGLFIVAICVGILAYIGFLIIRLDYPLVLALFAMATNVIPFLGPFIGAIPAVIVGALNSPVMMLKVVVVVIVVQQIESLVISPQVMGRKLSISPLTIILLIMVAGRLGGLLGMILAVPSYKILKIVVIYVYSFIQASKATTEEDPVED